MGLMAIKKRNECYPQHSFQFFIPSSTLMLRNSKNVYKLLQVKYIQLTFDKQIFGLIKDHLILQKKKQVPFSMVIANVGLMHECITTLEHRREE